MPLTSGIHSFHNMSDLQVIDTITKNYLELRKYKSSGKASAGPDQSTLHTLSHTDGFITMMLLETAFPPKIPKV